MVIPSDLATHSLIATRAACCMLMPALAAARLRLAASSSSSRRFIATGGWYRSRSTPLAGAASRQAQPGLADPLAQRQEPVDVAHDAAELLLQRPAHQVAALQALRLALHLRAVLQEVLVDPQAVLTLQLLGQPELLAAQVAPPVVGRQQRHEQAAGADPLQQLALPDRAHRDRVLVPVVEERDVVQVQRPAQRPREVVLLVRVADEHRSLEGAAQAVEVLRPLVVGPELPPRPLHLVHHDLELGDQLRLVAPPHHVLAAAAGPLQRVVVGSPCRKTDSRFWSKKWPATWDSATTSSGLRARTAMLCSNTMYGDVRYRSCSGRWGTSATKQALRCIISSRCGMDRCSGDLGSTVNAKPASQKLSQKCWLISRSSGR